MARVPLGPLLGGPRLAPPVVGEGLDVGQPGPFVEVGRPRHQLQTRGGRQVGHLLAGRPGDLQEAPHRPVPLPLGQGHHVRLARARIDLEVHRQAGVEVGRHLLGPAHRPLEEGGADPLTAAAGSHTAPLRHRVGAALTGPDAQPHEPDQLRAVPHELGVGVGMGPDGVPLVGQVVELEALAALVDGLDGGEQLGPLHVLLTHRGRPPEVGHGWILAAREARI